MQPDVSQCRFANSWPIWFSKSRFRCRQSCYVSKLIVCLSGLQNESLLLAVIFGILLTTYQEKYRLGEFFSTFTEVSGAYLGVLHRSTRWGEQSVVSCRLRNNFVPTPEQLCFSRQKTKIRTIRLSG